MGFPSLDKQAESRSPRSKVSGFLMRIALIHIQMISAEPMLDAFRRSWPEARVTNLLDEGLFTAPARGDAYVAGRFKALASYAAAAPADGILFTCSAFGAAIKAARDVLAPLPVLKPNEAMIEAAVATGRRVGLLASFAPTLASMPAEFPPGTLAAQALAEGAFAALNAGDMATHNRLVAETAARELRGCDVIALAQSSMAPAARAVSEATGKTVLTAPDSAVTKLRRLLTDSRGSA